MLKFFRKSESGHDETNDDRDEDECPTAPVNAVVEFSQSPHDRHRDLQAGNSIIERLDKLEMIIRSAQGQSKDQLIKQLQIFRGGFEDLLGRCYFQEFSYAPGTVVDTEMRSRIIVVEGESSGSPTKIAETIQCGFLYQYKDDDPVIIRKAEVAIT